MIKVLNVPSLYSSLYKMIEFCKQRRDELIEIVVPDKLSLFVEKFLFEKMNINASFNIRVSTLNRFAKKNCSIDTTKQISKIGSIILIHKILNDNINSFEIFQNKAYSFSYAEDIFKTISQLKASKISWEEMKQFSSKDVRLSGKIKDLALVYEEYENQKAGLLDSSDVFLMTTMFVSKGKEKTKILFVGFDDFTAIEYAIIERLAIVTEVNVFNYYSKNDNKFLNNQEVLSQLRKIAIINQLPFEILDSDQTISGIKGFLEKNLFAFNKETYELNNEIVKVYSGSNFVDEMNFVARDIRYKVLNGARFDDFGVAVFGLENNVDKIKEIFNKYDINYYLDNQVSISKSILYKFFVSVFKYNLEGYNLCNLIDIINSPFFAIDESDKKQIIQKLIEVNFRGKVDDKLRLDLDANLIEVFISFMRDLIYDIRITTNQLIEKFKKLDSIIGFDDVLNLLADSDVENKILLRKSKQVIFSLFDEILKFSSDVDIHSFFDIFVNAANVLKINNLPLSLDCVKIVDANNSMEIFNNLYLIGANHENAPNVKFDCGIILDAEINKLNFSNKLNPTISHINKLAKLRLFNSSLLFEDELTLTYSASPSELVKEILKRVKVQTRDEVMNIVPITRFDFDKYVILSKWDGIEFFSKNNGNNIKNDEKIVKNKNFYNISQNNLDIFDNFNNISATTLENYFKCPMISFLNNILKIQPRMQTEILAFDVGNVLHEIMFKFYKLNKNVEDVYQFCKEEVFKYVESNERLKINSKSPILINLIDEAVRIINAVNYIDINSNFKPKYFEFDFRGKNALELKNISIVGKVDRIDECGDMFRVIDYKSGKANATLKELYYGNKLQLFLYSCAIENVLKKKAVGTFYLPLHNAYTNELINTYSLKGFYLAEDFVVKSFDKRLEVGMKSDIVNVKINKSGSIAKLGGFKELSVNEFNSLKEYSKMVSENAVDEIKSGFICPTPSGISKPCEYCSYAHICLRNSNNLEYRKVKKIDLDSFKEDEYESV